MKKNLTNDTINKKDIVISYDDLYEGNDHWEEFEKLHKEFPDLKITFLLLLDRVQKNFLKSRKNLYSNILRKQIL